MTVFISCATIIWAPVNDLDIKVTRFDFAINGQVFGDQSDKLGKKTGVFFQKPLLAFIVKYGIIVNELEVSMNKEAL